MRQLYFDEIDALWKQTSDSLISEATPLVNAFQTAQPAVFEYFLEIGEDILTQDERKMLFFTGTLIWYTVNKLEPDILPELSPDQIFEKETNNLKMLEYLSGEPDNELLPTVSKIMNTYHQNTLLHYVIEYITTKPETGGLYNDDHTGLMVIYLKSFIDCLDFSIR